MTHLLKGQRNNEKKVEIEFIKLIREKLINIQTTPKCI